MMAAVRTVCALVCMLASWIVVGIIEFNATFIFRNSGVVDSVTHGFLQWRDYVNAHPDQFLGSFSQLNFASFGEFGWSLSFFMAPLGIALAFRMPAVQNGLLALMALLIAYDVGTLLQFDGVSSANGGFDPGIMIAVHCIVGLLSALIGIVCLIVSYWRQDSWREAS